jgi:hypothetical protein
VTSAFIIEVDSKLQPDPGDETAALLRVLIYEINNNAFGGNVPTIPQWTGPPSAMVDVQAILFASLSISLLSAFLAMLGKQWLNRYASADMRGSIVERSQNRQRKLDGIVAWYFDHVMETLPSMLQAALLLLGCALARYLWEISMTVASVVVGVTSFGLVSYIFITVAGAAFESCPYQTPGSQILRYVVPKVWNVIHPVPSAILRNSFGRSGAFEAIMLNAQYYRPWWSRHKIIPFLRDLIPEVPPECAIDIYRLGRAAIRALPGLPVGVYRVVRSANSWLFGMYFALRQRFGQPTIPSHLQCISWTLQTSLDKPIHLSTLEYLTTITDLTGLHPTLLTYCFNIFIGCVNLSDGGLVVIQGLDQLAAVSVTCFFRTFLHLRSTDPTSNVLVDLLRRYNTLVPFETDLGGPRIPYTIMMIHALAHGRWDRCYFHNFQWDDYRPSGHEYTPFARHMAEVSRIEYQRGEWWLVRTVPRWILRFALHSLSLEPPPPASVIADCLTIVAIDLECDVSSVTTSDERCVQI